MSEIEKVVDNNQSLEVVKKEPLYGDIIAYIWDIGLRPLFRPLVKLANNSSPQLRHEVKREWCEIIYNLTSDFVENYTPVESECIEWIYVLKKK